MRELNDEVTFAGGDSPRLIHEIIVEQARRAPESVAAACIGQILTYDQLERESARWAQAMLANGVKRGDRIGLALPRGCQLLAAMLGVWRAGCAYVPLDLGYPADWLAHIVRDAEMALVVTDASNPAWRTLVPELLSAEPGPGPEVPLPAVRPSDLAYLIFTSGTSGRPKGVRIRHGNVANFASWAGREFGGDELSAVLAATSICFDLSVFELFVPLTVGGTVVIVDGPLSIADGDPPLPPTLINTVPSVMTELLRLEALPASIRSVNLAGEPLGADLLARVWACPQVRHVRNLYAPSETTTYSTCARLERGDPQPSIGWPISDTQIHLLDEAGQSVIQGERGEIFIGGAGVADGYWRRPELTAERFLPDLFGSPAAVLYRTGDLGSRRADGALDYHGRIDEQVKIRGFRIETAEVEARLRLLLGVADAAVVAHAMDRGDNVRESRLAAFILPMDEHRGCDIDALRRGLEAELPPPMVPTIWRVIDRLPHLANGKLDRRILARSLAAIPTAASAIRKGDVSSVDTVAAEMADILGIGGIGPDDSFFAQGADSLKAAQLAARLRERFGVRVPAGAALAAPTPRKLAALLVGLAPAVADAEPVVSSGPIGLAPAQRQLWLFNRLYPDSTAHHVGFVLEWKTACTAEVLYRHCASLARAHPPLQAQGITEDGAWRVAPVGVGDLPFRATENERIDAAGIEQLAKAEMAQPFDLRHEPPWRVLAVTRAAGRPVLILTFHQIVIDDASIGVILEEFGRVCGDCSAEDEALRRYRDAPVRLAAHAPDNDACAAFWPDQFAAPIVDAQIAIAADPEPAPHRACAKIDAATVARVEAWARRHGTTSYRVALAAFALALARWSGKADLLIGSAFSSRAADPGLARTIGFFASALPLRIAVDDGEDLATMTARVHALVCAAEAHGGCPPEVIQGALERANPAFRTAPLPVMFGFLPSVAARLRNESEVPFDAHELFASAVEGELHCQCRWDKMGAVFTLDAALGASPLRADRLAAVLEGLLADLDAAPAPVPPRADSVFAAFEDVVRAAPDAVAIRDASGGTISYAALQSKASAIAARLAGIGSEQPCGLLMSDQALAIAAALACLRQGLAFVPLNPAWSGERMRRIGEQFGLAAILCDHAPDPPVCGSAALRLVDVAAAEATETVAAPVAIDRATLGYVLPTSGSTGRPKGVAQSQHNMVHHARTYAASIGMGCEDRVALLTTIHFDAGLMDIFGALLSGAALHIWPLAGQGLTGLPEWLRREAITIYHSTPSVFRGLMATACDFSASIGTVRAVVLGGEPVGRRDLDQFRQVFATGTVLVNGFGPTESTMATQAHFDHRSVVSCALLPIGRPVDGTGVEIVDDEGQPAEVGEIQLSGEHLFLGYVESAADYAQIRRSYTDSRTYRTGDLARRLADRSLMHIGRRDRQTKINGIRTEPAEIEQTILDEFSEIGGVAVLPILKGERHQFVAFVAARDGRALDAAALMDRLRGVLPSTLVPNRIVSLARFPLLDNGKINRRALTRLATRTASAVQPETGDAAPHSEHAKALGVAWQAVLGLSRPPRRDESFLALGGRSLEALIVIEKLRQAGLIVPARAMLSGLTLGDAAALIGRGTAGVDTAAPEAVTAMAMQRSFWLAEQLSPGTPSNQVFLTLRFDVPVDGSRLAGALAAIVARHAGLRRRFVEQDGELRVLTDAAGVPEIYRLASMPEGQEIGREHLGAELIRPFDLAAAWPLRAGLFEGGFGVTLVFHHICVDAWSVQLIAGEVARLCIDPESPPHLATVTVDDAAARLDAALTPDVRTRGLDFWNERLAEAPCTLDLPTDRPRLALPSRSSHRAARRLPRTLVAALIDFCAQRQLSESGVMLAAWAVTLWSQSGKAAMRIGVPVSVRSLPDETETVGPLINLILLPARIDGTAGFGANAESAARLLEDALDQVLLPFETLATAAGPGGMPLYQASFSYHRAAPSIAPGVCIVPSFAGGISGDIALTVEEEGSGITLAVDMAKDAFFRQRAERVLDQLEYLIELLLRDPDMPLDAAELLPPRQRDHLLAALATGRVAPLDDRPIAACIAEQAMATPDATALAGVWGRMSYAELIERSTRTAELLRSHGVEPGWVIPVDIVPGRPDFAVGALAAWIAGAAYMPVDPCWPAALRDRALAEAGSPVAIRGDTHCVSIPVQTDSSAIAARAKAGVLYAMYTSGSTGTPKAATARMAGIQNRFAWMTDFLQARLLAPATIQTTSSLYDSSVWQLFWPLTVGGRCVIPEPETLIDSDALAALVADQEVDVLDLVPSVAAALLPEIEHSPRLARNLRKLRWLILGGESVPSGVASRLRRLVPNARITNLYGPTEASIGCIYYEIGDSVGERVPIGNPLPNCGALVLDPQRRLVPLGAAGELWLTGDCVGGGYLGTGEPSGFEPCPVPQLGDALAYRTGDVVRWNEGGHLEYLGRSDGQVKIRGFRIDLDGIEAASAAMPGVRRVAAVAISDVQGAALALFVQPLPGIAIEPQEMRAWLGDRLPASHRPSQMRIVETIPLTASGKTDRRSLAGLLVPHSKDTRRTSPPPGTADIIVARAWSDVLGTREAIGHDVNFFDAGGHSFLLLRLRAALAREGASVTILQLFRHATIRAQAALIEADTNSVPAPIAEMARSKREIECL